MHLAGLTRCSIVKRLLTSGTCSARHTVNTDHVAADDKAQVASRLIVVRLLACSTRSAFTAVAEVASLTRNTLVPLVVRLCANWTRTTHLASVRDVHIAVVAAMDAACGSRSELGLFARVAVQTLAAIRGVLPNASNARRARCIWLLAWIASDTWPTIAAVIERVILGDAVRASGEVIVGLATSITSDTRSPGGRHVSIPCCGTGLARCSIVKRLLASGTCSARHTVSAREIGAESKAQVASRLIVVRLLAWLATVTRTAV